jgi:hypothetical protein
MPINEGNNRHTLLIFSLIFIASKLINSVWSREMLYSNTETVALRNDLSVIAIHSANLYLTFYIADSDM